MKYRLQTLGNAAWYGSLRPLLLALAATLFLCSASAAQTPAPQPQPQTQVSAEELERLVKTLESDADRKRLIEELKGLIAVQRGKPAEEPGLGAVVM
jgi:hypothetical protein